MSMMHGNRKAIYNHKDKSNVFLPQKKNLGHWYYDTSVPAIDCLPPDLLLFEKNNYCLVKLL